MSLSNLFNFFISQENRNPLAILPERTEYRELIKLVLKDYKSKKATHHEHRVKLQEAAVLPLYGWGDKGETGVLRI